jgi:hypothetical protein
LGKIKGKIARKERPSANMPTQFTFVFFSNTIPQNSQKTVTSFSSKGISATMEKRSKKIPIKLPKPLKQLT